MRRTRFITQSLKIHHYALATALASKAHPWISYLIHLLRPTVNHHHAPQLPKQISLVSRQNEGLPPSVLQAMQQEKLAGRHILHIVLQSSFGTLIHSKKNLGYIHTRSGMQGACSMYTSKSCARRGFSWASIYTASRASIPSLPPPRRCTQALGASAVTTGYPRFHSRSSPLSRRPSSVTPPRFIPSGVRPPLLPHRLRRSPPRPTNPQGTLSQRQPPLSHLRSPTETRVHPFLPTFPSPAPARRGPLSRGLRACPTCLTSVKVGAGSRAPCDRKRWARLGRTGNRSSPPCLHPRSSV